MGFNFRKSIKIAPGVRVNIGKKGVSSVSVGRRGASVNVGRKGARANVGIPGTGLSYSTKLGGRRRVASPPRPNNIPVNTQSQYLSQQGYKVRKVSLLLGLGIFIMPYIFAWFTLRKGHSEISRILSFGWLALMVIIQFFGR